MSIWPAPPDSRSACAAPTRSARHTQSSWQTAAFCSSSPPTTIFPSRTITETRPTWRLGLDHKFDDNLVYASYNRGFKSGGFNAGTPSQDPYNPEILDAYELGLKSVIAQRFRLNDAIYYYKYSNYQAAFFNQSNIEVANAAARTYGA